MKRFISAACLVFFGIVLGVALLGTALHVGAIGVPTAAENGDTNGDGNIDISDAVHLLSFLFLGGPGPAAIDCPPVPAQAVLVSTGQKECWGLAGPVDCSIPRARGQDAFYGLGCPKEDRFVDNGDGTISDSCTGLIWTKTRVDVDSDFEITSADALPWLEACQFAEDMNYLGYDDWRTPNAIEIVTILNFNSIASSPSGEGDVVVPPFEYRVSENSSDQIWSSTTAREGYGGGAYTIKQGTYFCNVQTISLAWKLKAEKGYVVGVRGPFPQ